MTQLAFSPSRLAAAYNAQPWSVVVPGTGVVTLCVPGDPNRVLLTMISTGAATVQFFPYGTSYLNSAWIQSTATVVMTWTYHDYGVLVGMPWYARIATGGATLGGITMAYDPSLIGTDPATGAPPQPGTRASGPLLPLPGVQALPALPVGQPLMLDPALQLQFLAEQRKRRAAARLQLPPYKR